MAKVCIETYGCTLNRSDSDILAALLQERHELVGSPEDAEVIVLNTCTVKGATENKIFERMRSLLRDGRRFVVAGCLSANEQKIARYAPLAPILGTSALSQVSASVDDALCGRATVRKEGERKDTLPRIFTSPVCRIPINDGCASSCHFCQTKIARPFLRSHSPKTIARWIHGALRGGACEIQLASQDCGAYGQDIRTNLLSLLDSIANDDSSGRPGGAGYRIRLGMINPEHAKRMLPGIIHALSGPAFYKFLHVPVQSGSEDVCRQMNRKHSVEDFRLIVRALRHALPEACLATDIIVGYPTETEEDFSKTLALLRETAPDTINLSKFSPRPGTVAKRLKQLDNREIKRRSEEASALIRKITSGRRKRYVGRRMRVLITEKGKDFKGRADNYLQVVVRDFPGRLGDFVDVDIYDANHGSLFGDVAEHPINPR